MTEPRARRTRLSKRALRLWAWVAGGLAFLSPWAALALSPKPAAQAAQAPSERPVIIVRRITRRVIVRDAPRPSAPQIRYVSSGSSSSAGSAVAPPTTTTSGSHP
jgi:hypothetical protein